jgi:molecular chaperone DnaK
MPQVEVTFDIDANGIVNVSAKDKATGKEQQIRIQASGGLSEVDIKRMVKEAEMHAADDKRRRERVEARNHADAIIHSAEKDLKEYGDKIAAADKEAIERAIADLKGVMDGEDVSAIQSKTEVLGQARMKLGEAMYRASQGQQAGAGADASAGGASAGGTGEKVVDAEFEEVDPEQNKKAS